MPRKKPEQNGPIALMEPPEEIDQETVDSIEGEESSGPVEVKVEYRDDPAWEMLHELSAKADLLEANYQHLNEDTKRAKKAWETALDDIQAVIRSHRKPMPLFDKPQESAKDADVPPGDAWRDISVEVLRDDHGLTPKATDALVKAGLTTLGKVADYCASGKLLTDLDGMTDAGFELYLEADGDFWKMYRLESTRADDESED